MWRETRLYVARLTLALLSLRALCQAVTPVTLTVQTAAPSFETGKEIRLTIMAKNVSGEVAKVFKTRGTGGAAEDANAIEIRDSTGHLLPRIDGRKIQVNGRTITVGNRWASQTEVELEPEEEFSDYCIVTHLFDLKEPGTYSVTVRASIPTNGNSAGMKWQEIKSNTISVTIIQ